MTKRDQRRYQRWASTYHRCLPQVIRGRVDWNEAKHLFFCGLSPELAAVKYEAVVMLAFHNHERRSHAESRGKELIQCV